MLLSGMMGLTKQRWVPVQPTTPTDSDSEDEEKTETEMMANMTQQSAAAGREKGNPVPLIGCTTRIIHTLRILTTDRNSTME